MPCVEFGSTELCLAEVRRLVCINGVECPSTDPNDVVVTPCVAEVTSDPVSENEDAIEPDTGCSTNEPCWKIEPCSRVTGENVTVRFGAWNPLAQDIMGGDLVHHNAAGTPIGPARKKGTRCQTFSLEIYGLLGTAAPNCGPVGLPRSTYYVWPHLKGGIRSGVTLSKRQVHYFTLEGATADAPTCWGGSPTGAQLGPRNNFPDPGGYDIFTATSQGSVSAGPLIYSGALPTPTCPTISPANMP